MSSQRLRQTGWMDLLEFLLTVKPLTDLLIYREEILLSEAISSDEEEGCCTTVMTAKGRKKMMY